MSCQGPGLAFFIAGAGGQGERTREVTPLGPPGSSAPDKPLSPEEGLSRKGTKSCLEDTQAGVSGCGATGSLQDCSRLLELSDSVAVLFCGKENSWEREGGFQQLLKSPDS